MKDSSVIFDEFLKSGRLDIVGDPDLFLKLSESLLCDLVACLGSHPVGCKPECFESLSLAQDNFAHVANLLAYFLNKQLVILEVKNVK